MKRIYLILTLAITHLMCIVVSSQFTKLYYSNQKDLAAITLLNVFPFLIVAATTYIFYLYYKEK